MATNPDDDGRSPEQQFQDWYRRYYGQPGGGQVVSQKPQGGRGSVVKEHHPQGLPYYHDSWLPLMQSLEQGQGLGSFMPQLLQQFRGKPSDLEDFLRRATPFLYSGMSASPATGYLQNFQQNANPMAAYGQGSAQIGAAGAQAQTQGTQQLSRMGLGRSAARGALASKVAQGVGTGRANLYSDLYQRDLAMKQQAAAQAFDVERQIAQLALGGRVDPRVGGGGGDDSGLWSQILGGVGTLAGAYFGGPAGAAAGGAGGTAVGQELD